MLNVYEDGIWLRNGRAYPHILPIAQRRSNILPAVRDRFWSWFDGQRIRLHRDFHHLNSSQALCFNLFFPLLIQDGRLAAMVAALRLSGAPTEGACFEFEPDSVEGTNFDFMIPLATGSRIYFEVKYTEADFGSAQEDDKHLRKFEEVYHARTAERFEASFCTTSGFLANYQILRNLWHLDLSSGDTVVFLFPRANEALSRAEATIRSCLLEPYRSRAVIAYTEDVISALGGHPEMNSEAEDSAWFQFGQKYFPSRVPCR